MLKEQNKEEIDIEPTPMDEKIPSALPEKEDVALDILKYKNLLKALREALRQIADKHNASMAQVALNWCRSHNVIPLVGCRSKQQASDTLTALDWDLFSHERELLDSLALTRCTLDSPVWRRKLFVILAGLVMSTCRLFDLLGLGVVKQSSIGM